MPTLVRSTEATMKLTLCLVFVLAACDDRAIPGSGEPLVTIDGGISDGSPNDLEKRPFLPHDARAAD